MKKYFEPQTSVYESVLSASSLLVGSPESGEFGGINKTPEMFEQDPGMID